MKSLSLIIIAMLAGVASHTPGESDVFYQEADERFAPPLPPAAMSVVGEIRSVDENQQPRLWGKGRRGVVRYGTGEIESVLCLNVNGNVEFGLSNVLTHWDSADHGCPSGTWVCSSNELSGTPWPCNTDRIDSLVDGIECNGAELNFPEYLNAGWISDVLAPYSYQIVFEDGTSTYSNENPCRSFPVWCCSEYQP
jgi:hypothetical protein